jgi:hypothetical protein
MKGSLMTSSLEQLIPTKTSLKKMLICPFLELQSTKTRRSQHFLISTKTMSKMKIKIISNRMISVKMSLKMISSRKLQRVQACQLDQEEKLSLNLLLMYQARKRMKT